MLEALAVLVSNTNAFGAARQQPETSLDSIHGDGFYAVRRFLTAHLESLTRVAVSQKWALAQWSKTEIDLKKAMR